MRTSWKNARTRTFDGPTDFSVDDDCLVIYANSTIDERSSLDYWRERSSRISSRTFAVIAENRDGIDVETPWGVRSFSLRDDETIRRELQFDSAKTILDISGLSHHVWAALLRVSMAHSPELGVVYAEPVEYRLHTSPASPTAFDLSDDFGGLKPLPGFARIVPPESEEDSVFIALLGFEGMRGRRLLTSLDPAPRHVVPIVGHPGFQMEFPNYTVSCNREFFHESDSYNNLRIAKASCPFDALETLQEIARDYPDTHLYLAPVGTKPHALATVLFALDSFDRTEIMYDFPVRRQGRSKGVGRIHLYTIK